MGVLLCASSCDVLLTSKFDLEEFEACQVTKILLYEYYVRAQTRAKHNLLSTSSLPV